MSGRIDGRTVLVGADRSMTKSGIDVSAFSAQAAALGDAGKSPLYAAIDGRLAAIIAVADPIKDTTPQAIKTLHALGLKVAMITGDNRRTAQAIARQLDIDEVVAEVLPDGKVEAVRKLRSGGRKVAFIGDGINDAPAIHAADVGLSVEGGTEVAREAAAIVLLAPDLGVLAQGIAEGRRTYANIMKYVRMGTSSNFGNMLSMALASMVLPFLPLNPLQILINNMLYDLSEVGIPFDEADPADLAKPQHWDMHAVLRFTLVMGPLSSVFDVATFAVLLGVFGAGTETFRTAWFVESILTQILVIFVIRTAAPCWRSRPHRFLVMTSLGALAAALILALTPLGHPFGFVALPVPLLLAILVIAALYLGLAEILKPLAMRAEGKRRRGRTRHSEARRFRAF